MLERIIVRKKIFSDLWTEKQLLLSNIFEISMKINVTHFILNNKSINKEIKSIDGLCSQCRGAC